MTKPKKDEFDFETALGELNKLVDQMEKGGLTLEDSLQHFERGIILVRQCQNALKIAEQKVQILTEKNGHLELTSYQNLNDKDS